MHIFTAACKRISMTSDLCVILWKYTKLNGFLYVYAYDFNTWDFNETWNETAKHFSAQAFKRKQFKGCEYRLYVVVSKCMESFLKWTGIKSRQF